MKDSQSSTVAPPNRLSNHVALEAADTPSFEDDATTNSNSNSNSSTNKSASASTTMAQSTEERRAIGSVIRAEFHSTEPGEEAADDGDNDEKSKVDFELKNVETSSETTTTTTTALEEAESEAEATADRDVTIGNCDNGGNGRDDDDSDERMTTEGTADDDNLNPADEEFQNSNQHTSACAANSDETSKPVLEVAVDNSSDGCELDGREDEHDKMATCRARVECDGSENFGDADFDFTNGECNQNQSNSGDMIDVKGSDAYCQEGGESAVGTLEDKSKSLIAESVMENSKERGSAATENTAMDATKDSNGNHDHSEEQQNASRENSSGESCIQNSDGTGVFSEQKPHLPPRGARNKRVTSTVCAAATSSTSDSSSLTKAMSKSRPPTPSGDRNYGCARRMSFSSKTSVKSSYPRPPTPPKNNTTITRRSSSNRVYSPVVKRDCFGSGSRSPATTTSIHGVKKGTISASNGKVTCMSIRNRSPSPANRSVRSRQPSPAANTPSKSIRSRSPSPVIATSFNNTNCRMSIRANSPSPISITESSSRLDQNQPILHPRHPLRQRQNNNQINSSVRFSSKSNIKRHDTASGTPSKHNTTSQKASKVRSRSPSPSLFDDKENYNTNQRQQQHHVNRHKRHKSEHSGEPTHEMTSTKAMSSTDMEAEPSPVVKARRILALANRRAASHDGNESLEVESSVRSCSPYDLQTINQSAPDISSGADQPISKIGSTSDSDFTSSTQNSTQLETDDVSKEKNLAQGKQIPSGQIAALSEKIFSPESGLSNDYLRNLLKPKHSSSKQWELRKRVEQKEEELKKLRLVIQELLKARQKFTSGAIEIEEQVKLMLGRAMEESQSLSSHLQEEERKILSLTQEKQELIRERDLCQSKMEMLRIDLEKTKSEFTKVQQQHTQATIDNAVLQSKHDEFLKQVENLKNDLSSVEASKSAAIREAELSITAVMDQQILKLQKENSMLRTTMQTRDQELCRMFNLDLANAGCEEFDGATGPKTNDIVQSSSLLMNSLRRELDTFKCEIRMKEKVEEEFRGCKAELERVKIELADALKKSEARDRDMSELTKGISDIQRSGLERENEIQNLRKEAEARAAEAEKMASETREQFLSLSYEKKSLEQELEALKSVTTDHESTIHSLHQDLSRAQTEIALEKELRCKAEEKEKKESSERIALSAQIMAVTQDRAQSEAKLREAMEVMERDLSQKHREATEEAQEVASELECALDKITVLESQHKSLKEALSEQTTVVLASKEEEIGRLKGEVKVLKEKLQCEEEKLHSVGLTSEARVNELEDLIRQGEQDRRKMHNIIQELRGNVRVFARIRPFLPGEKNTDSITPLGETSLRVSKPNNPEREYEFSFDRVFAPNEGQDAVFGEVSEFVQSALDGYNVCLFSYGQTGSGKTYTMQGTGSAQMGLIPRSIEQIGQYKSTLEADGWDYSMHVTFLEIYNESIRDLLRESDEVFVKHEIKIGEDGNRTVTNLTVKELDPNDKNAVSSVLQLAARRRSVASTDMNAVSSRSHSVFTLDLTAKHEERNQIIRGKINLVDLAGSERLDRSGVEGKHAKEAMSINKSLSSLTDVFSALAQQSSHIPFRNSKLTYLLQPCLSNNGKTLMIVNISPNEASVQESICSLRFASEVAKVELGRPKRGIQEVRKKEQNSSTSKDRRGARNEV